MAGVLFALLFGTALVLIRTALPEGAEHGSQWVDGSAGHLKVAAVLMPFAGITFLWFIGVVRDGIGKYEDKFFSSVFVGSGLLFLAMMFASSAVGAGLVASRRLQVDEAAHDEVVAFGQALLTTLTNTYALRMGAVFMISLATIWLKTRLMPTWLVAGTYLCAVSLLIASRHQHVGDAGVPGLGAGGEPAGVGPRRRHRPALPRRRRHSRRSADAGHNLTASRAWSSSEAGTSSASSTTTPSSSASNNSSETIMQLPDPMQASRSAINFTGASPPHRQRP